MENIAFPARDSIKSNKFHSRDLHGIEIFTSNKALNSREVHFIGEEVFDGSRKYHYLVSADDHSMESILEMAGVDTVMSAALIGSIKQPTEIYRRPKIMAVANATPDSFYEGSRISKDVRMLDEIIESQPDIIDVGGESTRPGSSPVSVQEEIRRISPVIDYISSSTSIPVSLDTRHPEVLEHFVDRVEYANDVGGFMNRRLIEISSEHSLKCVTMHMRGQPENMQTMTSYVDLVPEVISFLWESAARLISSGVDKKKIIVDPGLGFSKNFQGNMEILRNARSFSFGFQTLFGASRKSFIGEATGKRTEDRLPGTLAVTSYLAMNGADIIRVHDPKENLDVVNVLQSIFGKDY